MNSASDWVSIDGLDVPEGKEKITGWLEREGLGERKVNYKLRDWLFSRQRYWGEPFPVVWVDGEHRARIVGRSEQLEHRRDPDSGGR